MKTFATKITMQNKPTASGHSRLQVKSKALLAVAMAMFAMNAQSQTLAMKYDTKNHAKAKGVWATIRYPSGWEAKEGERPNIVQKFSGDYNGMFVVLSLQIVDAGGPVEKECSSTSGAEFSDTVADKSLNQIVLKMQKSKHEDKPSFIYEVQQQVERAGMSTQVTSKVMTVCYKNTMISTSCGPMVIDKQNQRLISTRKEVQQAESLCFQFFNSLVLMDKY